MILQETQIPVDLVSHGITNILELRLVFKFITWTELEPNSRTKIVDRFRFLLLINLKPFLVIDVSTDWNSKLS